MLNNARFLSGFYLLTAVFFLALVTTQVHADKKSRLPVDRLSDGLSIMVLGSGGPVATNKRVSSGYLIFTDGKPRILMDVGGGVFHRIGQSGANIGGLESILFTHLHVSGKLRLQRA